MRGIAFTFMALGVLAVLIGMVWGIVMAASQDHTLAPAHAHLNLLGFVLFSVFAIYYHVVPEASSMRLARIHCLLSVAGLIVMVPGIALAISGVTEAGAILGSFLTLGGMVCFGIVVLRSRQG